MKDFFKSVAPFLVLGAICLILGIFIQKGCQKPKIIDKTQYFQKPGFKTDTLYLPEYIPVPVPEKSSPIPPKTVTIHDTILYPNPIYLPGKSEPIIITKYNKGLLFGYFSGDSLNLDIMDTSNRVISKSYQMDYKSFNYLFDGEDMHFIEKGTTKSTSDAKNNTRSIYTESNFYLTYEVFKKQPQISTDYSINYKKVGLYTRGQFGYLINEKDPQARLELGIRIKLK